MNKLTWSKPSRYNMQVILGLPENLKIAIAANTEPLTTESEVYLTNTNTGSFTKQKQFFGSLEAVKTKGEKWARELTGLKVAKA